MSPPPPVFLYCKCYSLVAKKPRLIKWKLAVIHNLACFFLKYNTGFDNCLFIFYFIFFCLLAEGVMIVQPLRLGAYPCTMICPHCQARVTTTTYYRNGLLTWAASLALCLMGWVSIWWHYKPFFSSHQIFFSCLFSHRANTNHLIYRV